MTIFLATSMLSVPGITSVEHLEENVQAAAMAIRHSVIPGLSVRSMNHAGQTNIPDYHPCGTSADDPEARRFSDDALVENLCVPDTSDSASHGGAVRPSGAADFRVEVRIADVCHGITANVALTPCSDLSPADWIVSSTLPWQRLVGFGPADFAAYARLRFLPDPAFDGQRENDVEADPDQSDSERLRMLFEVLATHTRTPEDCYFCLWDGSGDIVDHDFSVPADDIATVTYLDPHAQPGLAPEHAQPPPLPGPRVNVPNRSYYLFQGALSDADDWAVPQGWPAQPWLNITDVAFVWPADHAWCVANDVDPHWAGMGAGTPVIDQLVADPRLDVVPADPSQEQPVYR